MQSKTFTFKSPDGPAVFVYRWAPDAGAKPKAQVQIAHGAAEHAGRYERFGRVLAEAGYVVYADDHRGHGKSCGGLEGRGIAGPDAWNGMLRDQQQLSALMRSENPGLPLIFFGHSMGSLIAQQYIQTWGGELKGAVLSGSFGTLGVEPAVMVGMLDEAIKAQGADAPSEIFAGMFSSFNQGFEHETGFEWLSRDAAEVRKYVDDPYCGFAFSNALVRDLFAGAGEIWAEANERRIPKELPLLVASGDKDPAGGDMAAVHLLVDRYRGFGLRNVTLKAYPGARHEILNETNRDEVHRDIVAWLDAL